MLELKVFNCLMISRTNTIWQTIWLLLEKQNKIMMNHILCGVPQGPILGPLLFLVYVNDLRYTTRKSLVNHFADDTKLIVSNRSMKTLRNTMNKELNSLLG